MLSALIAGEDFISCRAGADKAIAEGHFIVTRVYRQDE